MKVLYSNDLNTIKIYRQFFGDSDSAAAASLYLKLSVCEIYLLFYGFFGLLTGLGKLI